MIFKFYETVPGKEQYFKNKNDKFYNFNQHNDSELYLVFIQQFRYIVKVKRFFDGFSKYKQHQ